MADGEQPTIRNEDTLRQLSHRRARESGRAIGDEAFVSPLVDDHQHEHQHTAQEHASVVQDAAHHIWTSKIGTRDFGDVLWGLASPGDDAPMELRNMVRFLSPHEEEKEKIDITYSMPPAHRTALSRVEEIVESAFRQAGDANVLETQKKELLSWVGKLKAELETGKPVIVRHGPPTLLGL